MTDENGYRENVGIIILNEQNKVFYAQDKTQRFWQFPQGGLATKETPLEAMYRELYEEVGLRPRDVKVIAATRKWYKYDIPGRVARRKITKDKRLIIGQKQKWFLLRLNASDNKINLKAYKIPEFNDWCWVDYWYPVNNVTYFKQDVYRRVLTCFELKALSQN